MAGDYMRDTLEGAGLTSEVLAGLSSSENPQDKRIADTAAASATAMGMAQLSYEESAQSLERIDGLVEEIGNQTELKDSIDLNTRMAA
jgi:type IV secretion system protein VirB5